MSNSCACSRAAASSRRTFERRRQRTENQRRPPRGPPETVGHNVGGHVRISAHSDSRNLDPAAFREDHGRAGVPEGLIQSEACAGWTARSAACRSSRCTVSMSTASRSRILNAVTVASAS